MSHKLSRLSKSILDQPQLITQERFEEIAAILETTDRSKLHAMAADAQLAQEKLEFDSVDNGLSCVVEKFKNHPIATHVTLNKGERSLLASEAAKIL